MGLQSIVEGTGNSFAKAQAFIEAYTKDGLVPAADAATALKIFSVVVTLRLRQRML